jgi:predicted CopG family antitoxin
MPKKAQKPAFDRTVYTTVSIPDDTYAKLKRMADEDDRKISRQLTRYINQEYDERYNVTA